MKRCPKCSIMLSSAYRVKTHLEKPMPCDFVCRLCDDKCQNRHRYYYHMKKHKEQELKEREERLKLEEYHNKRMRDELAEEHKLMVDERDEKKGLRIIVGRPDPSCDDMIAPNEFHIECINSIQFHDQEYDLEYLYKLIIDDENSFNIQSNVKIRIRTDRAISQLRVEDFTIVLHLLKNTLNNVATEMLNNIHGNPERPLLQSIRMADFARRSVNIFTRLPQDVSGTWYPYTFSHAKREISKTMRAIITYTFGVLVSQYKLEQQYCPASEIVCFSYNDLSCNRTIIIHDSVGLDACAQLYVQYYDGELTACPEKYMHKARTLQKTIETRLNAINDTLPYLEFTDDEFMDFIERTRRPFERYQSKLSKFSVYKPED